MIHEMQISVLPPRSPERSLPTTALRQVFAVSRTQAIDLAIKVPSGRFLRGYQICMDSHPQRRLSNGRVLGEQALNGVSLLQRIESIGEPTREYSSDPLLWLSRIWWAVRTATLAFHHLQSPVQLPGTGEISGWPSPPSIPHRAMAAWACRRYGIQPGDDKLRLGVLDGLHRAKERRHQSKPAALSYYSACNRFLWSCEACGIDREDAALYL